MLTFTQLALDRRISGTSIFNVRLTLDILESGQQSERSSRTQHRPLG